MQKRARSKPAPQEVRRAYGQGQIGAWVEAQISEGKLRPGDRVEEKQLCDLFNVSRTPVREALLQLASIGLVTFQPRQGAVVAQLSVKELVAMWEVLMGLEGFCAELAARRMPPDLLAKLSEVHESSK